MDDLKDAAHNWGSRSHTQTLVLMLATGIAGFVCYLIAAPFLSAVVWALTLAVLFTPLQRWLESKTHHPNVAALIAVLVIALIVVVPMTFVVQRLTLQAASGADLVADKVASGEWRHALEAQPRFGSMAKAFEDHLDLPGTVKSVAAWLSMAAGSIVKGSVYQVINFCLVFYLLFFFLRDRHTALNSLRALSPLPREVMIDLFTRVADTIHATIYGTLAVSAIQGLLGGLMFWWLGLPAPLLWGVVMAFLAIVPVLGAFVVWVPAALFLALEGSWGKALILTLWGALVVGTIDNLLRPVLVGNKLKLHTVLAFMSVIGGLMLFGPCGFVLGPITLTVTIVLLEQWTKRSRLTQDH